MTNENDVPGTTDTRTRAEFINDLTEILQHSDLLSAHSLRSITWQTINDYTNRMEAQKVATGLRLYWTKAVRENFDKREGNQSWNKSIAELKKKKSIQVPHFEHTVPIKVFVDILAPLDRKRRPTNAAMPDLVRHIFNNLITVCWVTSDENKRLELQDPTTGKGNLRSCMPEDAETRWEKVLDLGDRWCFSRYLALEGQKKSTRIN
jgi:hypothetical protein